jgi:hypothetical protein
MCFRKKEIGWNKQQDGEDDEKVLSHLWQLAREF